MTNEEKANEIARCDCQKHYKGFDLCNTYKFHEKKYCGRKAAALEAMEWKDEQLEAEKQQWIDKACEWLKGNMYEGISGQMLSKKPYPMRDFINEFKNAMKGE